MKMPYGRLLITINAEQEEIDGEDELALSDQFVRFEEELIRWMDEEMREEYPEFTFDVSER